MRTVHWVLAGVVAGVIAVAFRDFERGEWLSPAYPGATPAPDEEEPILGYDGMDQESFLHWLEEAELDASTIERIIRYEEAHLGREPVLDALGELLG
jgi:hypothetical protein